MIRFLLSFIIFAGLATSAGAVQLDGRFEQGGMVIGHTQPGARVALDGKSVHVGADGIFVFGFDRDAAPSAWLSVTLPNGKKESRKIAVEQRKYDIQRINGLPKAMVTPPPGLWKRIKREAAMINKVREVDSDAEYFTKGFIWPAKGIMTGVYGSQRILNGKPKRPHLGLDVAAPVGTPIHAPASGTIMLAQHALYYTGGTVMIDHGHGIISVLMHMHSVKVKVGEKVKQGDIIGTIGATGRVTGPHVDWRVNWFHVYLDPQFLVKGKPDGHNG